MIFLWTCSLIVCFLFKNRKNIIFQMSVIFATINKIVDVFNGLLNTICLLFIEI